MTVIYNKPGIYLITCIVSRHQYVGSTAGSFTRRWNQHKLLLRRGTHDNKHLQNAWNKYWASSFIFEVLEVVEDKDALIEREQFWIDTLNPTYNIGRSARNPMLGRHHTEASNQKNREWHLGRKHTDEAKLKLSRSIKGHPNYLKSHTDEAKRKISAASKGHSTSDAARAKISQANRARWAERLTEKTVLAPDGTHHTFMCAKRFALEHGLSSNKLCDVVAGRAKVHKGWSLIEGILEANGARP